MKQLIKQPQMGIQLDNGRTVRALRQPDRRLLLRCLRMLGLLLAGTMAMTAMASTTIASKTMEQPVRISKLLNPAQSTGVRIGDLLHRHIELEVKQPYQLSVTALPVKGANSNGVELSDVVIHKKQQATLTLYSLDFSYQVFRSANTPIVLALPAEKLAFTGGPLALAIDVPAWRFWLSPLVVADIDNAMQYMQAQLLPAVLYTGRHQALLALFAALLLVGVVGMVYVNADLRWLPLMGGAFAVAYRRLKRIPQTAGAEKPALACLHHAFNQVYGKNLFAHDIDAFVTAHPAFRPAKAQILAFFEVSNRALFAPTSPQDSGVYPYLMQLSRQLRDCERGV